MTAVRVTYYAPVEITVDVETGEISEAIICIDRIRSTNEPICYAGTNIPAYGYEVVLGQTKADDAIVDRQLNWRIVCE